jgi:hypothetical protein
LTWVASLIRMATPHEMVLVEGTGRVRFCEVVGLLENACPPNRPEMRDVLDVLSSVQRAAIPVAPVTAG